MEREEKFTPGRWEFDPYSGDVDSWHDGADGLECLEVCEVWVGTYQPKGNGYLIAAAPEMYDALKDLMSAMDDVVANSESIPDCIMWVVEEAQEKAENAMKKSAW